MKPNNHIHPNKFYNVKGRWTEFCALERKTESRKDESESFTFENYQKMKKDEAYIQCIEHWDKIKQKYLYNHLYRKRVLKIDQKDLEKSVCDKTKITSLLEKDGKICAQYVDKSKNIDVRGQGVWNRLNGAKPPDMLIEESSETQSESVQPVLPDTDIIKEIKKCLIEGSHQSESEVVSSDETQPSNKEIYDQALCKHILEHKHKKLFIVPECLDDKNSSTKSSVEQLTEFSVCIKELKELVNTLDSKELSEEECIEEVKDPWSQLKEWQTKTYGYSDLITCPEKLALEKVEEYFEEDFHEKLISNLIEKEVTLKGVKIKIKKILEQNKCEEISQLDVTLRGKDGEYISGLTMRWEKEAQNEEEIIMKQVLESLVGEWVTMRAFLQELALSSAETNKLPSRKESLPKRLLNPLGQNVLKMVSEMIQENQDEARDLEVKIKYKNSQLRSSLFVSKDQAKNLSLDYREKVGYKIQKDKKGEQILSKQKSTLKECEIRINGLKLPLAGSTEKTTPGSNECICKKPMNQNMESSDKEHNMNSHRGLVELISGGKYAGSWNYLGMEGCGIYISPGGTIIDGYMRNEVLNGPATVYLPNGMIIAGVFDNGQFHSPKIQFGDGLEYKHENWDYLKETEKLSKSKIRTCKPLLNRDIPAGCYDTGEGFYHPGTKLIYHPVTNDPIRSVSEKEEKWILSICRGASPKCVSLDEHFYEMFDIPVKRRKTDPEFPLTGENPWKDCQTALYNLPFKENAREMTLSPDSLLEIGEKSKPVEELWKNIRALSAGLRAKVGVPFSYEKAIHYTCNDGNKVLHLQKQ